MQYQTDIANKLNINLKRSLQESSSTKKIIILSHTVLNFYGCQQTYYLNVWLLNSLKNTERYSSRLLSHLKMFLR